MPTTEQDLAILQHQQAQTTLALAKEDESIKRQKVCDLFFPNGHVPKGTNNIELGNGYVLKIVGKLNFTVDAKEVDAVKLALSQQGEVAAFIGEKLFKHSYELSVTQYNDLPPNLRPLVLPAVSSKPGTPTVEVIAPKAGK
jgi:hypothetical protein